MAQETTAVFEHQAQVPGYYRFAVGDAQVTAILDGYIDVDWNLWVGATFAELEPELKRTHVPSDKPLRIAVNAYVINIGDRLVAIDTGSRDLFGPTAGRYHANLAAAGIDPADISVVIITHMHPDHIGGLLTDEGARAFLNADIIVQRRELAYWTSDAEQSAAADYARPWFDAAKAVEAAYGERLKVFDSDIGVPGFRSIPLEGHTPGHQGVLFESGNERILFAADILDLPEIQFPRQDVGLVFDVDIEQGVHSRREALEIAADGDMAIAISHVSFPGVGRAVRDGEGFRYYPSHWSFDFEGAAR
ncbi:MAG: MBL fold metallo-hydrolase [Erythrobacter sp.]